MQQAINKIQLVKEHLHVTQCRQKSYANHLIRDLEFQIGEHVFLRVSPT